MRLVLLLVLACMAASKPKAKIDEYGYAVIHAEQFKKYGTVELEYKCHEQLVAEETERLDNRMADSTTRADALGLIPLGGYCVARIDRPTIASANPKEFEFLLLQGGEEISRERGKNRIPRVPGGEFYWHGLDVIGIAAPVDSCLTVYVIDVNSSGRDKFEILDTRHPVRKRLMQQAGAEQER